MNYHRSEHFVDIYSSKAEAYHQMIEPEDVDQNLLPSLEQVVSLKNKRILDLGTGTGRLPLLLATLAARMICFDLHEAMLKENQRQRSQQNDRWTLGQADMQKLPLKNAWAEVVTAGWAIGHMTRWFSDQWQRYIGAVLEEMHRVTAPGGSLIIIETLTTGTFTPAPPSESLARYYEWLEQNWGFSRQEIRTDYQFASTDEAAARMEFFFGADFAATIRQNNWTRVPEWTGIWSKQLPDE